jgi:hypothetical protein
MTAFLFSCENATCAVPEAFREIFLDSEDVVTSTEGWEPGALNLAQGFAMKFRTPLVHGDVTRLLIDYEKDGEARWSRFSIKKPVATRTRLAERHALAYRILLGQRIAEDLRRHESVLHVMVHTDAATDGRVAIESPKGASLADTIAAAWRNHLYAEDLDVRHFRNGDSSALAADLSRDFPPHQYAQIRLEVSQTFFLEGRPLRWEDVKKRLLDSLAQAV